METVARLGVSAIVEFVVTPPRVPALRRLEAAADCLMIETVASHAAERAAERDRHDPFLIRTDVLEALGHRSIDDYIAGPERAAIRAAMLTDFDLPRLRVTTDDGYDPELAAIVDWTIEQRRR